MDSNGSELQKNKNPGAAKFQALKASTPKALAATIPGKPQDPTAKDPFASSMQQGSGSCRASSPPPLLHSQGKGLVVDLDANQSGQGNVLLVIG
jgi:hypothetical protein